MILSNYFLSTRKITNSDPIMIIVATKVMINDLTRWLFTGTSSDATDEPLRKNPKRLSTLESGLYNNSTIAAFKVALMKLKGNKTVGIIAATVSVGAWR